MREWIQKQYSLNHCYSNNCLHKLTLKTVIFNLKQANKLKKKKRWGKQGSHWGFSSVSHWVVSDFLQPHGLQHARPPCPLPTPGVYSNSCPLSQWCRLTISSSVVPFSSHLQPFPVSGSYQRNQLFTSGGQSIEVSASSSVLPVNIQDWFPLRWTGWLSLQSKGPSRVFTNTTVQKHQFFGAQLSLHWSLL